MRNMTKYAENYHSISLEKDEITTEEELINDILQDYEILSSQDISKYLMKSMDMETLDLLPLYINLEKLKKLIKFVHYLRRSSQDLSGDSLIKLSVIMYSNILDSDDTNVKLMACQVLLNLCTCSMASAYGISTAFILKNISGVIHKCIIDVIHGRNYRKKLQREEMDEMETESVNTFQTFHPNVFYSLLNDYQVYIPLYSNRNEEYILEQFAETLAAAVCLSTVKDAFMDTLPIAKGAMALFGLRNEASLSATYRSLLPLMTLAGRDSRLPDSPKLKIACHSSCLEIVEAIFRSTHIVNKRCDESRRQSRRVSIDSVEEEDNNSRESNFHGLSMPYVCAIGFIQRLMMTSSEKNIPKTQLTSSLATVITAVHTEEISFQSIQDLFVSKKKSKTKKGKKSSDDEIEFEDIDDSDSSFSKDKIMELVTIDHRGDSKHQRNMSTERLLAFVLKLSKSAKLNHRSLCLDLASNLLSTPWMWERHALTQPSPAASHTGVEDMIEILITRCSDVTATVRGRALGALLDLFEAIQQMIHRKECENSELIDRVYELLMCPTMRSESRKSLLETLRDLCMDDKPLVKVKAIHIFGPYRQLCDLTHLLGMMFTIEWPCQNQNSSSKKLYLNDDDVSFIADRCTDQSVAVRKEAVSTLTQLLLSRKSDSSLQQVWIESVLPLIHDPESTIQVKITQGVIEIILLGCTASPSSLDYKATWSLCSKISELGNIKFLKSALGVVKRNSNGSTSGILNSFEKNLPQIFESVKMACSIQEFDGTVNDITEMREIDSDNMSRGGWVLLEALISQNIKPSSGKKSRASLVNGEFVVECWSKKQQQKSRDQFLSLDEMDTRILQVMSKIPVEIELEEKNSLTDHLTKMICNGTNSTQGIAAALAVILSFAAIPSNSDKTKGQYNLEWLRIPIGALLNYVHEALHKHLWNHDEQELLYPNPQIPCCASMDVHEKVSTEKLCSSIFLLGEIAMLGFSMEEDEDTYKVKFADHSLPIVAVSEISHTFRIEISSILVMMIQTLMGYSKFSHEESNTLTTSFNTTYTANSTLTQNSSDFSQISDKENSSRIRAQSFVTMGKLCLRSRQRARENVTIFLREIQCSDRGNSAVRSNAILVLGDMCVRFTNLVDRHVGSMARCLQDPDGLVRRHSFILLTQLLLQDYLKWRGMLLFRFLATILDQDEEMASLARYVLKHTLQTKYPGFIVQNFTESIIVFNNCADHVTYQTMAALGSDSGSVVSMEGIDLHGSQGHEMRMRIYQFMLEDITEEEKIQITANISQDIFSYTLDFPIKRTKGTKTDGLKGDNILPLEHALIDSFKILQSPLLKIGKKASSSHENDEGEEGIDSSENGTSSEVSQDLLKASFQKAKTKVLKKLSVQHLIDHMLPLISSLKHLLESLQSPVQKALMEYLVFVMKNHKQEATQALSSDPSLKEEIEYDIKIYEKEKLNEVKRKEILAAERAVVELEISTARKLPLMSPIAQKGPTTGRRLSLSVGKVIATPILKKLTSEKRRNSFSAPRSDSFDIQSSEQVDDFTLRITESNILPEEREVTKRRWSVSAEQLEVNSDTDDNDKLIISTKSTPQKIKKQISSTKRSHYKENTIENSLSKSPVMNETSPAPGGIMAQPSDTFISPLKKKNRPSKDHEMNTSISSLTGLGQFAAMTSQTTIIHENKISNGIKKIKGTKKRNSGGDVLGALK